MKKYEIINILQEKMDETRDYEFWLNDLSGDFGGTYFFRTEEEQREFEKCEDFCDNNPYKLRNKDGNLQRE